MTASGPIRAGERDLPRVLGMWDAASIVAGTMIGSAIFLLPSAVAQNVPSITGMFAVWIFAGVISMFGALAYAELGAMMPDTGGQYVYLRESWGPLWGFLCGWTFFLAARSAGTASVAAGFSIYLSFFFPLSAAAQRAVAALLILLLTAVNYRGVRLGATVQNILTGLKVTGLVVLIVSMFLAPAAVTGGAAQKPLSGIPIAGWTSALIACLWAYNGWFAVSLIGGEVRNPERNLPRGILAGTIAVMAIYLFANVGYLRILGLAGIAASPRVSSDAAALTMGAVGASFVALTILVSTFGTVNGNSMTAPRIYFAQARDGLFFAPFARIHPTFHTPHVSIVGQGIWSAVLALSGSYIQLVSYATVSFWVFYAMAVAGLIRLRRSRPDAPRAFAMPGYPVTAWIFIASAALLVGAAVWSAPGTTLIGLLIIASGVPAYAVWRRRTVQIPGRSGVQ